MNIQPLLVAAAIGLFATATVTFAQLDAFKPLPNQSQQQAGQQPPPQGQDRREFRPNGQNGQNQFDPRGGGQPQKFGDQQFDGRRPEGMQNNEFLGDQNEKNFQGDRGGLGDPNKGPEDTRWLGNGNCKSQEECDQMQQKADERREQEEKRMDERRFQDMKRGMKDFGRGVASMKKMVSQMKPRLAKCSVGMPQELTQAIDMSSEVIAKIDAAKTADELENIVGTIEEVGGAMQEWGPKMGDLGRLCEMLKRADKDFKRMKSEAAKIERRAKSNKKIDLSELVNEYKAEFTKIQQALETAKQTAKTDPDEALSKLEDEFYGGMEDFYDAQKAIDMAINATRGLQDAKRELADMSRAIKRLKSRKIDVSELEGVHAQLKKNIDEFAGFIKQKKVDPDELIDRIQEIFEMFEELGSKLEEQGGMSNEFMPKIKQEKGFDFVMPRGFEKQGPSQQNNGDGGQDQGFDERF